MLFWNYVRKRWFVVDESKNRSRDISRVEYICTPSISVRRIISCDYKDSFCGTYSIDVTERGKQKVKGDQNWKCDYWLLSTKVR